MDGEIPGQQDAFRAAPFFVGPSIGARWHRDGADLALGLARRSRAPTLKERFSEAFGARPELLAVAPISTWS